MGGAYLSITVLITCVQLFTSDHNIIIAYHNYITMEEEGRGKKRKKSRGWKPVMKKEMDRSVKSLKASDKGSYYRQEECYSNSDTEDICKL